VGINVSIFSNSGANDGVGFAVPSDIATAYADAIVSGEPMETAFLGVRGDNVNTEGQAGALITEVTPGSAADESGIEVDDVIVGFGGVSILGFDDLFAQVRAHQPGETVEVIILRDEEQMILDVILGVATESLG
jgi:S1-C subfamily serine protease